MAALFLTIFVFASSGWISGKIKSPIGRAVFGALFFAAIMLALSPMNAIGALFVGGSWSLWIGAILKQVEDRRYFRKIIKDRGYPFNVDKAMKDMKSLGKSREFIVQIWESSVQISDNAMRDLVSKSGMTEEELDSMWNDSSGPEDFYSKVRIIVNSRSIS